jgi:hypothetical protein
MFWIYQDPFCSYMCSKCFCKVCALSALQSDSSRVRVQFSIYLLQKNYVYIKVNFCKMQNVISFVSYNFNSLISRNQKFLYLYLSPPSG